MPDSSLMFPPPTLSTPALFATQSASTLATSSKCVLPSSPDSSYSSGNGFCIGSVYKIASSGVRRLKNAAVYASIEQGIVMANPSTQSAISSYTFSSSMHPTCPPLVILRASRQSTVICLSHKTSNDTAEIHTWSQGVATTGEVQQKVEHHSCRIDSAAQSLHPLFSGDVLVQLLQGAFCSIKGLGSALLSVDVHSSSSTLSGPRWTHHISVFDRFGAASMLRSATKKAEHGLVVRVSSSLITASNAKSGKKGRKSAIELIDAVEGSSYRTSNSMRGAGPLTLDILTVSGQNDKSSIVQPLISTDLLSLLGLRDAKDIVDLTLHHTGRLVFCTSSGEIGATTLRFNQEGTTIHLEPIVRIAMAFRTTAANPSALDRFCSLQLVTSTTVLVIVPLDQEESIMSLLIDLDLGCVLAETMWKVKGVQSVLAHRVAGSTALVLANRDDASNKASTSLWALPYEVSEGSHLRWALARSALTRRWMKSSQVTENGDDLEESRCQLLKELESVSLNRKDVDAGKAIDEAFDKWQRKETSHLEAKQADKIKAAELGADGDSGDSDHDKQAMAGEGNRKKSKTLEPKTSIVSYPSFFITRLLNIALPSSTDQNQKKAFARRTVHHLLSARIISSSMRTDLLASLMLIEDWEGVLKAVRFVRDLPETEVVNILLQTVKSGDKERLDSFMTVFITKIVNRSNLRLALKTRLEEMSDILIILRLLSSWLDQTQDTLLGDTRGPGDNGKDSKTQIEKELLPKAEQVLSLLIDMLDTYFPLFLTTDSSHEQIKNLSEQVKSHLTIYNQLLILRGPLAAFARLDADRKKEAAMEAKKRATRDAEERLVNLRKAQKKAVQGKYNVIGEVGGGLGKGIHGDKSRRRQMYEENIAVGLYSLDKLVL